MNNKSIYFAMGIHNHQPVGNFDYVLEDAYNKAYLPFLECLERHPSIKVALHFTGPLWDKYMKPEYIIIEKIRNLVRKGQVEMLSGGYYEPILVNISDRDKVAQIKKMNRLLRREVGFKADGMWCAERIWEPGLAKPIALSDIKYTILDESHFRYAGLQEKDMFGYYVTEEQGHAICVIPINQNLRWMIPYRPPEEIIDYLKRWATPSGTGLGVFADDGEKFGVWPGSFHIVWEEHWMDRFFDLLEKNADWIKITTFSEYLKEHPPLGRIYIPTASYYEMGGWSLSADAGRIFQEVTSEVKTNDKWQTYQNFLKGGFWRNFLVKYPESNRIQKKALFVSEKVQKMVTRDRDEAENELFKGQCNCPYWHGVFGGIYLPHLRHAVQECLIRAESLADSEFHKGKPYKEIEKLDINRDLFDEIIINTTNLQMCFYPHTGGALYELDYKPLAVNLCDTLTRREETYHCNVHKLRELEKNTGDSEIYIGDITRAKEKKLYDFLKFDRYQRFSFIDHFISDTVNPKSLWAGEYEEKGDFIEKPYEVFTSFKDDKAVLTLSRKGSVNINGVKLPVEVEKTFLVPEGGNGFRVQYWINNDSDKELEINFSCEINLSFLSKELDTNFLEIKRNIEVNGETQQTTDSLALTSFGEHSDLEGIILQDGNRNYRVVINFGQNATFFHFPIETISMSEDGFEKVYQSTTVMPVWQIKLDCGDNWDNTLELHIEEIEVPL